MAVTYFGLCDSSGNPTFSGSDYSGGAVSIWNGETTFTCPGSGNQTVKEMSCMCHHTAGTPHVRLAIYNSAGTSKIVEGSAEVTLSGASDAWQGHTGTNLGTIVGGTSYKIAVSVDANVLSDHVDDDVSPYQGTYTASDYTGGFPASLSGTDGWIWPTRVGVEAADTIEQEGFRFRNDDGSESAATWKANQDVNITLAADTAFRLRFLLKATGNPDSIDAQAEARVKPSGGAFGAWEKIN